MLGNAGGARRCTIADVRHAIFLGAASTSTPQFALSCVPTPGALKAPSDRFVKAPANCTRGLRSYPRGSAPCRRRSTACPALGDAGGDQRDQDTKRSPWRAIKGPMLRLAPRALGAWLLSTFPGDASRLFVMAITSDTEWLGYGDTSDSQIAPPAILSRQVGPDGKHNAPAGAPANSPPNSGLLTQHAKCPRGTFARLLISRKATARLSTPKVSACCAPSVQPCRRRSTAGSALGGVSKLSF
jgi:hypothetical protein